MRSYLELEATFSYIEPRIWRRFQLRTQARFSELRRAVSDAFCWERQHVWELSESYRDRYLARGGGGRGELARLFPADAEERSTLRLYDFADGWAVQVRLLRRVSLTDGFRRRLLAGDRAAPLEECGGVAGYQDCVAVAHGTYRAENRRDGDFVNWVGPWKPDAFDLELTRADFDR